MAEREKESIYQVTGRTGQKVCQPCSRKNANNIANVYCVDCGEYHCDKCVQGHQLYSFMEQHKLVHENEKGFLHGKYDMKGLDKCTPHGKTLKFLCEDHSKLCCSSCVILTHRMCHSVVEIEERASKEEPELSNLEQELIDIESTARELFLRVKKTKEKLVTGETETFDKIQDMQDKVNEMFEELKRKVSRDIDTFKDKTMKELNANETSCNTFTSKVKLHLSDIKEATSQGTPVQKLIMTYYLRDQVRELKESTTREIDEFKDIRMNFDFDVFLTIPPHKTAMPGRLTLDNITGNSRHLQEVKKVSLKLLTSADLKQEEYEMEEPFYSGLDFLPDGRLVAVDNKKMKCIVYSESLEPVGSCELYYYPVDVVSLSEDVVAVTSSNEYKIDLFEINENSEISLRKTIEATSEYGSICLLDHSNLVAGTIDEKKPVRVVSTDGEEKDLGITCPPKTYPIDHSACTYLQNYKKVIFSDRFAHTVYIDDIVSKTRVEVKDEKLIKEPRGLAVGPGDSVFVCNARNNSIVQISHTGEILSSHVLDMKMPSRICVSKDHKKLAVGNYSKGKVKLQLYEIVWE